MIYGSDTDAVRPDDGVSLKLEVNSVIGLLAQAGLVRLP